MEDITVTELKSRMDAGEDVTLIDVREPSEHAQFNIGGRNLPLGGIVDWSQHLELPVETEIVLYCRSGNRSMMAKGFLAAKGFTGVRNLTGGMIAWSKM